MDKYIYGLWCDREFYKEFDHLVDYYEIFKDAKDARKECIADDKIKGQIGHEAFHYKIVRYKIDKIY